MKTRFIVILCGLVMLQAAPLSIAEENVADVTAGRMQFRKYCASCHGTDAKGNGPVAFLITKPVPDLTGIRARNNGVFPRQIIAYRISGEEMSKAHGTREMPVWGEIFDDEYIDEKSDKSAETRLGELMDYLESLQE